MGEPLGALRRRTVHRVTVRVARLAGAEALDPRVLVERPAAADSVPQPVGEGSDPGPAEISLPGLDEQRVVRDLAEVPALAVQVDRLAVDAVLGECQLVQRGADLQHVRLGVVTHQVVPEAVHVVVARPAHCAVDHDLLGHRMLGRDVAAAGRGLDLPGGVEPLVVPGHDLVQHRRRCLTRGRGVVEDLIQYDAQPGLVQSADHRAELGHPRQPVLRACVRPLWCEPVERVVAPVEPVLRSHRCHAGLLLLGVGRQRLEIARRRLLPGLGD